ncbi:MAG TPA: ABC transporter permease [Steroidobacteraceae bacterium]|nr:ABC transporter permease [Steroidobacteraceae bacterium]
MAGTPLRYFVLLALRSFRRDLFLTITIMLTLGVGIAASMTVFSILHVLSGDPIPEKSARLFQPTLSNDESVSANRPHLFSLPDAQQFIKQLQAPDRGTILAQGFAAAVTVPGHKHQNPSILFTSPTFFTLFDVPFLQGSPWSTDADATGDHVVVLSRAIARELFGATPALGKMVSMGGVSVRVVGVTDEWHPIPHFYDLTAGAYAPSDNVYVPLKSIRDMNSEVFVGWACGNPEIADLQAGRRAPLLGPRCEWLSVWTELFSPEGRQRLETFLSKYVAQLKKDGHAAPSASGSLPNVLQSLQNAHVVPGDIRAYTVMGFLFLWLCVLSATGTLLGKFLRRSSEIGVRRALGASRNDILMQFLVESGSLGVGSGILGILFAETSLTIIRHSPTYLSGVVGMSGALLAAAVTLAVMSGLLAGLLPAWRAAGTDIGVVIKVA